MNEDNNNFEEFIDDKANTIDDVSTTINNGDIYENIIPSAEDEEIFYDTLAELSRGGDCAVVAIAGNHDLRSMDSREEVERVMGYNHSTFSVDVHI